MVSRFAVPALALLASAVLAAAPAAAQTLPEAVTRAIERFPELRIAAARQRATQEQIGQARGPLYPSIDASIGAGRETSDNNSTRATGSQASLTRREAEVTLTQLLFDGGQVNNDVRRSEARAAAAGFEHARTAEDVAQRTALAYFEVQRLRALAALAIDNVAAHERTFYQIKLLADSGAGRQADATQALSRLALAQSALLSARAQARQAEVALQHLVGIEPGALSAAAPLADKLPRTLAAALERGAATHPGILAAQRSVDAALAERESVRGRLGPRLTLEAGATHQRNLDGLRGLNADQFAMLRLRYNLFRGGADEARIREAEARVDETTAQLALAQEEVARDLRGIWSSLELDRARLPELEAHARATLGVVEAYRAQFRIGQRTLLDVLNAESERFNARGSAVSAAFAIAGGEIRLLGATGALLAALDIAVPGAGAGQKP